MSVQKLGRTLFTSLALGGSIVAFTAGVTLSTRPGVEMGSGQNSNKNQNSNAGNHNGGDGPENNNQPPKHPSPTPTPKHRGISRH